MSPFKTKDYNKPEPTKVVYGGGKKLSKPKPENPFLLKKKKKELKDKIIRDIWTLFETEGKKKRKKEIREKRRN